MTANLELESLHHLLQILCYAKVSKSAQFSHLSWGHAIAMPDPGDDSNSRGRVERDVHSRRRRRIRIGATT
eukprot:scaffold3893_cov89-Skeletonema_dohrnii-CCMP3373.AAC.5